MRFFEVCIVSGIEFNISAVTGVRALVNSIINLIKAEDSNNDLKFDPTDYIHSLIYFEKLALKNDDKEFENEEFVEYDEAISSSQEIY